MDPNNMTHPGNHQQPPSSTTTKLDKAKLAGKGADLLHTASSFGKSKSKSIGKYLGKAENYLRKYHDTHSTTSTPHGGPANTVPLGYTPPTSAPHDYPVTNAPHGDPATAAHPPIGYPATVAGNDNPYPSQPTGGIGKYLGKAENYLRKYHDTHSTTSTPHGGPANTVPLGYTPPTSAPHDYPATNAPHGDPATAAHPPIGYPATVAGNDNPYPSQPTGGNGYSGGGHGNSGGGLGDYMKKASGFLKKH